jgi:hypothetical protein
MNEEQQSVLGWFGERERQLINVGRWRDAGRHHEVRRMLQKAWHDEEAWKRQLEEQRVSTGEEIERADTMADYATELEKLLEQVRLASAAHAYRDSSAEGWKAVDLALLDIPKRPETP